MATVKATLVYDTYVSDAHKSTTYEMLHMQASEKRIGLEYSSTIFPNWMTLY